VCVPAHTRGLHTVGMEAIVTEEIIARQPQPAETCPHRHKSRVNLSLPHNGLGLICEP
jgi:hypothetical protein